MKTVRLTRQLLIVTDHHEAGTKLTLTDAHADLLVKKKHATPEPLDMSFLPSPPRPRQMLPVETADARPGPKKIARVVTTPE